MRESYSVYIRKTMLKAVDDKMKTILEYLLIVKQYTISDINAIFKESESTISGPLRILKSKREIVQNIHNQVDPIKKYASNFQTFIGIKEIEKIVYESNQQFQELSQNEINIDIKMVRKKDLEETIKEMKSFSKFRISTAPKNVAFNTIKSKQAQTTAVEIVPTKLNLQKKFDIGAGRYIGCCLLPNKNLVIIDKDSGSAMQFDREGSQLSVIAYSGRYDAYDVTSIDENHVVVSNPATESIS